MSFTGLALKLPVPLASSTHSITPVPGNGFEVRAVSSADYHTLLTVLPRWQSIGFSKMLGDKGSVNVVLNEDDPVFSSTLGDGSPGTNLLDTECLWQFSINNVTVMDGLGETITEGLVDSTSEQRQVTIAGPGTLQCLTWGLVMPPGFPNVVFKTDAISDSFSEVDVNGNPLLDTSLWNLAGPLPDITLNPLGNFSGLSFSAANPFGAIQGTCQLTATPSGTVLAGGPYDITNSVISAQVTPMTPSQGLNGSEVTQMYVQSMSNSNHYALIGLSSTQFYTQLGDTTGISTKVLGSYDATNDAYWMITEQAGYFFFWASADGQSWTELWAVPYHWDATSISVNFAAIYNTSNAASVGVSNINSNVTVPTTVGSVYLNEPIMAMWHTSLVLAQARGTIPFITTQLTSVVDSFQNLWTDSQSAQLQNGTDLYSLLQSCTAIVNATYRMQPGFNLQVGLPLSLTGETSLGIDLSKQIIFHESDQITTKTRTRARDQIQNSIAAVNQDGTVVAADVPSSITQWNQREGWVTTGQQITPEGMLIVAEASVDASATENLQWTVQVAPLQPGHTALIDFDVGDWIGMERPGIGASTIDVYQVAGIAYTVDQTGLVVCELTLNSYRQWLDEQLTYLVNKFGGNFINAQGATLLTAVPVQQKGLPFVINPDLGGLTDVTIA